MHHCPEECIHLGTLPDLGPCIQRNRLWTVSWWICGQPQMCFPQEALRQGWCGTVHHHPRPLIYASGRLLWCQSEILPSEEGITLGCVCLTGAQNNSGPSRDALTSACSDAKGCPWGGSMGGPLFLPGLCTLPAAKHAKPDPHFLLL